MRGALLAMAVAAAALGLSGCAGTPDHPYLEEPVTPVELPDAEETIADLAQARLQGEIDETQVYLAPTLDGYGVCLVLSPNEGDNWGIACSSRIGPLTTSNGGVYAEFVPTGVEKDEEGRTVLSDYVIAS